MNVTVGCMLSFDSHVHTRYSDGTIFYNGIDDLRALHRRHGFTAFTITDHNTTRGLAFARRACERVGIPFIPGVEVSAKEGHVVAYGIEQWDAPAYSLVVDEVLDRLEAVNAVIVPAHPMDRRMGIRGALLEHRVWSRVHGYEHFNGASPVPNREVARCAAAAGEPRFPRHLARYSGSDCHSMELFYKFHVELDCDSTRLDDILEAMRDPRKVHPVAPLLPVHLATWIADYPPAFMHRRQIKAATRRQAQPGGAPG